jgi:hypothetical protein
MLNLAAMKKTEGKHKRLIELPMELWNALDAEAERCRRTPLKHLDALLTVYFRIGNVELGDVDSVRDFVNPDSNQIPANTTQGETKPGTTRIASLDITANKEPVDKGKKRA